MSTQDRTARRRAASSPTKRTQGKKTLGPVSDLERHLPSDWWRHLFNSVYLKTDGDVVENRENTRREVDLVTEVAGLQPEHRILDICCGQGRHSLELARRGFPHVTGIDRSRYLIRLARRRASTSGLSVRFHEGDARKFRMRGSPFHCVMLLGNSFGYFDLEDDDAAVLQTVKRALTPDGVLVLDLTDGDWMRAHYQPRSWEWIDQNHLVCRERGLSSGGDRLITREVVIHAELGVIADQFYAERLYSQERITRLLTDHGFRLVQSHGLVAAESDRGQDLGMMAQRMFLTARSPADSRPEKAIWQPRVTVLLGDPSLPDQVKLGGHFNPEDLDTVRRLQEALAGLEGFEYSYLDSHADLADTLRAQQPPFVLNLCDEGFSNDPRKELHVPALLETLGIPYSGAGPVCLGLCYDKALVRAVAQSLDIPVPLESFCGADDIAATLPSTFPALVKPNTGDSSVGITRDAVVNNREELMSYLSWLRSTLGRQNVLIQEFLTGAEYSVGIVGNPGLTYRVLPILEVDYSELDPELPRLLSYESKWEPDSPYWTQIRYRESDLRPDTRRRLVDYSSVLFERLACRDYARFDFRADADGNIKLLEANPNPGWCWDGKMALMAGNAGLSYQDFLRLVLEAAQERCAISAAQSAGVGA